MKTIIFQNKTEDIKKVAQIIKNGGIVAFPTETVYGLGGDGLNERAVAKIFAVKGRPSEKAITLHINNLKQFEELALDISDDDRKLASRFWPGPLTIIVKKKNIVPDITTGGKSTVGFRMPANNVALDLIEAAKSPLAAPSANLSGGTSPTCAEACKKDLDGKIEAIIDGGNCQIGVESTVIDMSGNTPVILRQGAIPKAQIEEVLGKPVK